MFSTRMIGTIVSCLVIPVWSAMICSSVFGQDPPPNIIFILTDDQGTDAMESTLWSAGDDKIDDIATPTLSRLSDIGVSFVNARVNPNCSPTRAALMTGRRAMNTGVFCVLWRFADDDQNPCPPPYEKMFPQEAMATDCLSLQTYEKTLGEALQSAGYHTIFIDKWHMGHNSAYVDYGLEDRKLRADQQGFDVYEDWMDHFCGDLPENVGDEHMVTMADLAYKKVSEVPQGEPWALFFHTITPHSLYLDEDDLGWWKLHQDLIPLTYGLDDEIHEETTDTIRFVQNVEAIDTVIREILLEKLGVINIDDDPPYEFEYQPDSNTIVIFLGDNGTSSRVSAYVEYDEFGEITSNHAKGTPYEGGINVPMIVFGQGIWDTPLEGTIDGRQIAHVDFFDTICDIAGVSEEDRDNELGFQREGISFADAIGWGEPGEERLYTLSSYGQANINKHKVAFVSHDGYKLIVQSGGEGPHEMTGPGHDEFYDLIDDPDETINLVTDEQGMTQLELDTYYDMRDLLVDYWPISVSTSYEPDGLGAYYPEHFGLLDYDTYVLVAHVEGGVLLEGHPIDNDWFYNETTDPQRDDNLLDRFEELTSAQQDLYYVMRAEIAYDHANNMSLNNVCVVDFEPAQTRIRRNPPDPQIIDFLIGHENVNQVDQGECRIFLKFDLDPEKIPEGFHLSDARRAQIIIGFNHDSQVFNDDPGAFWQNDAPTGPIRVYRTTGQGGNLFDAIDWSTELGFLNLPPHVIVIPPVGALSEELEGVRPIPMPSGTPLSFSHNANLLDLFFDWWDGTVDNLGVALVADLLEEPDPEPGKEVLLPITDQHVSLLRHTSLRITFDRREYPN